MNIIAVDWGKNIRQRSAYRAEVSTRVIPRLEFDGRLTHLVEYAATVEGPVLIGIDAAIGFPCMAWNGLTCGETDPGSTFVDYLLNRQFSDGFSEPVHTPEEWSSNRPFIQTPKGSWSLTAFIEAAHGGFYREIDRRLNGNPIFVSNNIPGSVGSGCGSRIFMQPSEDRHGESHARLGIPQRRRVPLLVRDDRPARRYSRTGVFAKDDSKRDTTT